MNEKTVVIDNIKLNYYEIGVGKTVLFFHGGGVNSMTFKRNIELLSQNYHVIAVDLPGFGKSQTPKETVNININDFADLLYKFITILNLNDLNLIGHSYGGLLALHLACKYPSNMFSKIAIIDSATTVKSIKNIYLNFIFKENKGIDMSKFDNQIKRNVSKQGFLNIFLHFIKLPKIAKIYHNGLKEPLPELNKINIPTLILWGNLDTIFTLKDAEYFNKSIKGSKLVTVDGYHAWAIYEPEKCNEILVRFLG